MLRQSGDNQDARATLVGLDGWHLTRAQLDLFPGDKAQLAHDRRGAHWTFDSSAYVDFVRLLRQDVTPTSAVIRAPSFDHALKDPTPEAVYIMPHDRIIVIEGLYTFLSIEPWCQGGKLFDERWFLDVDIIEARRRLIERHVITGVARDWEEAVMRADTNDMPSIFLKSLYPNYYSISFHRWNIHNSPPIETHDDHSECRRSYFNTVVQRPYRLPNQIKDT